MSSMWGNKLKVSIFGQSHGEAIGVVADGLPPGEEIDLEKLQVFLDRRAPGRNAFSSPRKERDVPRILSGLLQGRTCGAPLCAVLENGDTRSEDYSAMGALPRPSHADYPAYVRYGGHNDPRGGGHFSGRLTAPLCVAGGIALQILQRRGVFIGAHAQAIGGVEDRSFDPVGLSPQELCLPAQRSLPVLEETAGEAMERAIQEAADEKDSVGGIVECGVLGLPAGMGDPMFDGVENRLAAALFGIPALRGVEFGAGFAAAQMRGSQHNDPYIVKDGAICTATNRHGGVIGGITTGMPVIFRAAFKPTASIGKEQQTVDVGAMAQASLRIGGRHDPCVVPRAVPCVEAVAALVFLDFLL